MEDGIFNVATRLSTDTNIMLSKMVSSFLYMLLYVVEAFCNAKTSRCVIA
jgi:hypothetical protein